METTTEHLGPIYAETRPDTAGLEPLQAWNSQPPCPHQTMEDICLDTPLEVGCDVTAAMRQYSLRQVAEHWAIDSCWLVLFDLVYDVTSFLHEHPGGKGIILEYAGSDATVAFNSKGHSEEALAMLKRYSIGQLIMSERLYSS